MGKNKEYKDWQLIHWLQDFAEELGKTPTQVDLANEPSMPSPSVYRYRFGSWNNALKKAGLEVNKRFGWSKEKQYKKMISFCEELGRVPSYEEINKNNDLPSYQYFLENYDNIFRKLEKEGYERKVNKRNRKLNEDQVRKIKKMIKEGVSLADIARKYDLTLTAISSIKHGRSWNHVELEDDLNA